MRLVPVLTPILLLLAACSPLTTTKSDSTTESEANDIGPQMEALQSINGDFDGDGEMDCATLYHIPKQTISDDSTTLNKEIEESYIVAFDNESISPKRSSRRLSHLTLLGDVDLDGKDEYGVYTHSANNNDSSWGDYSAYSMQDSTWRSIASTTLNVSLLESLGNEIDFNNLIIADSIHQGRVIVQHFTILDGQSCEISEERVELV